MSNLVTRVLSQGVPTDRAKCSQELVCLHAVCQFPVHNVSATRIISHLSKSKEALRYTVSHYTDLILADLLLNTEKNVRESRLKETS